MDCAIETEGVTGGYGIRVVLHSLSLRVPRGAVFGLLGPNGAGKTTCLRLFLGLLPPVSGEIRVLGQKLPDALPRVLRRVGTLLEQPSLYDHLTGRENLDILRRMKHLDAKAVERAIEALQIGAYADHRVHEYSRGMRQRLGVAMAALGEPELLLLDEPMNGLDAGGLESFRALVETLRREYGATVLISSHQLDALDLLVSHVAILNDRGDLLFQGTRQELSYRVPQELVIRVDRWEHARRLLVSRGHAVDTREQDLILRGATYETAREVNRILVENGIGVYRLAVDLATLETLFVQVTGARAQGSAE